MTAGAGHARAAQAVAEACRAQLPSATVRCEDLLADCPAWLRWAYPRIYASLVQYVPPVWGLAYALLDSRLVFGLCQPWRRRWNLLAARRFLRKLKANQPDVVIATHFFPADVVSAALQAGGLTARLIVVITDLFPHRLWLSARTGEFVVGSEDTRGVCCERGVDPSRVRVLGIPIAETFRPPAEKSALVRTLGLDPSRRTLLVASGGMGVGPIERVVRALSELEVERPGRWQLLVVCGHNHTLAQRLERLRPSLAIPLRVFGFVTTMHELMQASDLMVSKAGGLSVMEALAVGVPMIIFGNIPGQERWNADYVAQHGAGLIAGAPGEVVAHIRFLLAHPERLTAMQAQAVALGRPDAAAQLVDQLIATRRP